MAKTNIPKSATRVGLFSSANTTISQQAPSFGSSSGTFNMSSGSGSWTDSSKYDLENKCLDLEKLSTMDSHMRDMIFKTFLKFMDCTVEPQREVLYNTLEPYNVITDKTKLERKVKIGKVLSKKESDDED